MTTATETKLSTKRLVQVHCLADDMSSRASVSFRAADNAFDIGNHKAADYFSVRADRFQRIAEACSRRLGRLA